MSLILEKEVKTPWIPYPNRSKTVGVDVLSEYNNCPEYQDYYLTEIKRLNNFVQDKAYNENEYDFVLFVTGAVMNDYYQQSIKTLAGRKRIERFKNHSRIFYETWWRLMFPYQLESFKKNNPTAKILIIIIAPDPYFNLANKEYCSPQFLKYFDSYGWKNSREPNAWYSSDNTIEVKLFNCPVPGYNPKQNEGIQKQMNFYGRSDPISFKILDRLQNTKQDNFFVDSFYLSLDKLFTKIEKRDGLIMGINGAVINTRDTRSLHYGKSFFVKDLIKLFSKNNNKRLFGSWTYTDTLGTYCLFLEKNPIGASSSCFISPGDDIDSDIIFLMPIKKKLYVWGLRQYKDLDFTKKDKYELVESEKDSHCSTYSDRTDKTIEYCDIFTTK